MAFLKKHTPALRKGSGTRSGPPTRTRSTYQKAKRSSERPAERFQATCASCNALCEVPFKPNGKKPVYCRDCFKKEDSSAPYIASSRSHSAGRDSGPDLAFQFEMINDKLDQLIRAVEGHSR